MSQPNPSPFPQPVRSSRLPTKALTLWRLQLLFCCCLPSLLGGFFRYTLSPTVFLSYTAGWFGGFLFLCFLYFPLRWNRMTYSISTTMVKVSRGVLFLRMDAVFIRNIQYTSVTQTPLQRLLGLASLHIYAAGGSVHLPSLEYPLARQLRVQLLKRMEALCHE